MLIGMVAQDIGIVNELRNVHFLGSKNYDELPRYMHYFDVCIMPYKLNDEMINSNPKKLREYLASGKPVVSVRIREVERYDKLVYMHDGYDDFCKLVECAVADKSRKRMCERIKAMSKESWESRVDYISNIICKHIPT